MDTSIGFLKGMRQDVDPKLSDKEAYYKALNKQVVLNSNSVSGSMIDEPGHKLVEGLNLSLGEFIVKTTQIRDWLVSFIYNPSGNSRIIRYKITTGGTVSNLFTVCSYTGQWFNPNNIDCVLRYVDESLCKLYWVDGVNQLRHINIFANNTNLPITLLDISPKVDLEDPVVYNVGVGGKLKVGRYQYAYQLYNRNGSETIFSQLSNTVDITEGSTTVFSEFSGGDEDTISNKCAFISINNIDTSFEYIRVVSIYYRDDVTIPIISVISESKINNNSTIRIKDIGGYVIDTLTPEEFNLIGNRNIIPTTITTKDNYLIAGNIKEDYFDIDEDINYYWDARAYRFNNNSECVIYSSEGSIDITVNSSFTNVPEDFDCVQNKANQENIFKYKKNTSVLGGTGKNISYEFVTKTVVLDNYVESGDFMSPNNVIWNSCNDASLMRGEIYRFGIVFIKDGKYSFVKWIADILTPSWEESPPFVTVYDENENRTTLKSVILGIKFEVSNVPTGYKWQIVRVPRTESDRTILTQAVVGTIKYANAASYIANHKSVNKLKLYTQSDSFINKKLIYLNSPEINYNTLDISFKSGDQIQLLRPFKIRYYSRIFKIDKDKNDVDKNRCYVYYKKFSNTSTSTLFNSMDSSSKIIPLVDSIKLSPASAAFINNYDKPSNFFNKASLEKDGHKNCSIGNTSVICSLSSNIGFNNSGDILFGNDTDAVAICNYVRNSDGIYGGNTFINKSNNSYIKVSQIKTGDNIVDCYNGDTYLQLFEFLDLSYDPNKDKFYEAVSSTVVVPIETSVNINHVGGFLRSRNYTARELFILQETNELGQKLFPTGDASAGITTETGIVYYNFYDDVYKYNKVFSSQNQARMFFPKPFNFVKRVNRDYRIISSEVNNTEVSDRWLRFMFTSYQDLNTEYGKINKLIVYDDKLLAFQDKAVVIIGFNDRELVTTEASTSLTLGTGDRLTYHKYLTTSSGCMHPNSIIDTGRGLYYFDLINKALFRISESIEEISLTKGLYKEFNNIQYNTLSNVYSGFDRISSRVFFTFDASTSTTISFNEKLDAFESFHSYHPKVYTAYNGKLYVSNGTNYYIIGEGSILRFFNNQDGSTTDSYVIFVIGTNESKLTFTNIEFDTNILDYISGNYLDSTVLTIPMKSITLSNSYQTKTVNLDNSNLRRRFRTWRFAIPKINDARFVDYFLKVEMRNSITHTPISVNNTTVLGGIKVFFLTPII